MMKKTIKYELGLFTTVIIWATSIITASYMLDYLSVFQLLLVRFAIAGVIMLFASVRRFALLSKRILRRGGLLGLLLVAGFSLQTTGLSLSTPAQNAFLTAMYVVFVPLISFVMFRRKADKSHIAATVVAVIGAAVLSLEADFSLNIGDVMTVAGSAFYAIHIFYVSEYAKADDVTLLTTIQFVVCALCYLLITLVTGELRLPPFSAFTMLSLLHLGVICTALCFFLQLYFQRFISETKASIIFSVEAPISALMSVALGLEAFTARLALGSAVMFAALYIATIPALKNKQEV